jgi:hypothetical protein
MQDVEILLNVKKWEGGGITKTKNAKKGQEGQNCGYRG